MLLDRTALASSIEHTVLRPDATRTQIVTVCEEALAYGFAAVCVAPAWIALAREVLGENTGPRIATVIGFPHGNTLSFAKCCEAREALDRGAQDLDMVMAIGALRSGLSDEVREDVAGVVKEGRARTGVIVKVILETGFLTDEQIRDACRLVAEAGADFVKTSTGFGPRGATVKDVLLFREAIGDSLRIKAAGGIRDLAAARALLYAGANRLGCSASVAIMSELAS